MSVTGNATFASGSSLSIELGGTTVGTGYDHLNISGLLTLNGDLNVALINGFVPAVGSSFDLIDWGTRSGTFTNVNLPAIPNRGWDTSRLYVDGLISVTSTLSADYSNNGFVDAADFVTWRKNVGQPAGTLRNDTTGLPIGDDQYNLWRSNFGAAVSGESESLAAVPEPDSVLSIYIVSLLAGSWRIWRKKQTCNTIE
jgi:hypothetical protein